MDNDIENRLCSTTVHQHGGYSVNDLSCSDTGEAYVVPALSNYVYVYKNDKSPERWTPTEPTGNIQTVSVNKNFIVITTKRENENYLHI